MKKRLAAAAVVCTVLILLMICGAHAAEMPGGEQGQQEELLEVLQGSLEQPLETASLSEAFGEVFSAEVPDNAVASYEQYDEVMAVYEEGCDSVQEEMENVRFTYEELFCTVEIPKDIAAQIKIYVEQRDIWLSEWENDRLNYDYAWCDLNMDGRLELIRSITGGTGRYSESYIYAVGSSGEVELVTELSNGLGGCPDLMGSFELYADVPEGGQEPEHFYIRSVDYTPDGRFSYKWDMVVTFTADLTEWQVETIRRCEEEYEDATHVKLVDADYYDNSGDSISRREWERLGEEFLEGKELIADELTWDVLYLLYPHTYSVEQPLSDLELRVALENLYFESDNFD